MNGINATPNSPVLTPPPGPTTAGSDQSAIHNPGYTVIDQVAAQLRPGPGATQVRLAAPDPDALAAATARASAEGLSELQPSEVAFDFKQFILQLQQLMLKHAQDTKTYAREQKIEHLKAQEESMRAEAAKTKELAYSNFEGQVQQGAMQIAGGAVSFGLNSLSATQSIKGINQEAAGRAQLNDAKKADISVADRTSMRTEGLAKMKDAKLLGSSAEHLRNYSQAVGGVVTGAAGIVGGFSTLGSGEIEAARTEQAAHTKFLDALVQDDEALKQVGDDACRALMDMTANLNNKVLDINTKIIRS